MALIAQGLAAKTPYALTRMPTVPTLGCSAEEGSGKGPLVTATRDDTEVLLRRILAVNVAFLAVAIAVAAALVPPLRAYLRGSATNG